MAEPLGTAKLAAIGPGTHRSLLCAGLQCDYIPNEFRAEGACQWPSRLSLEGTFLLIRANRGRDLLRCELERAGHAVDEVVAYTSRDIEEIPSAMQHSFDRLTIDWITVTSSSIAESAIRLFGPRLQTWKVASISPITTATLIRLGVRPTVEADTATTEGIVQAILRAEKLLSALPVKLLYCLNIEWICRESADTADTLHNLSDSGRSDQSLLNH